MRQAHFRPLVIFSINSEQHRDNQTVHTLLREKGWQFQGMSLVENGQRKPCWLVLLDQDNEDQQLSEIQAICRVYDQPKIVYSGNDRTTKEISFDGTENYVGSLASASRYEALTLPSYYVRSCGNVGELEYWRLKNVQ